MTHIDYFVSPIGSIEITADAKAINSLYFVDQARAANPSSLTVEVTRQLHQYFAGDRRTFDLPLNARGTKFQQAVWSELCKLGFGETCSYQDIACELKNPKAVRAVGAANGKNPISIIVPCHRVIGADGALTGYAGGVERKAWLLKHEGALLF